MKVFLCRLSTIGSVEKPLNASFRALRGLNLVLASSDVFDPESLEASEVFDPESLEASEVFDPENVDQDAIDVDDPESLEAIESGIKEIDLVLAQKTNTHRSLSDLLNSF